MQNTTLGLIWGWVMKARYKSSIKKQRRGEGKKHCGCPYVNGLALGDLCSLVVHGIPVQYCFDDDTGRLACYHQVALSPFT